ncbi:Lateral flagellar export/assembly protein FlhB-like protein, partial [human gut metagenome]
SFPWYADFVRESFISVHQYAQEINNPDAIGQFLRHHLLILGKFILTLLPMPAAALFSSLVPGGWLFLPKKNPPGFQQNQPVKRHWTTVFQRTSGGNGKDDGEVGGGAGNAVD